ncbi:D-xylose 1-dehydrogenase (NADP(+)) [Lachnellula willkommii]|uniref:D-xylose 1-dehydrogenase (NADP(+), D-xylono-1,5-lactone-forming) n=1 Tax=Lachnellula willkommii TaxID=215461 RepID=A0A559MF26_9HELO|nr:D-xylose 1-dehydrogenase (NADP(+)) [Lachnellula willkommii]
MGALLSLLVRCWTVDHPPEPPKSREAIKIGILGTGWIAPRALITPAKSHPGVIIAAVASRDKTRAEAYARKLNIPIAYGSYQEMLDDPAIDAVYNPLPNSEHYEWSMRAIKAGKHVLLEKPCVCNALEAETLFKYHASLPTPRPVLLEAIHPRFHPAWSKFLSLVSGPHVEKVEVVFNAPSGLFPEGDIRWRYDLAGGALMDIGAYAISCLRDVFAAEPVRVESTAVRPSKWGDVDEGFKAGFRFPNGGVGFIDADIKKTSFWGLPGVSIPRVVVQQREMQVEVEGAAEGEIQTRARTVTIWGFPGAMYHHSIGIVDVNVRKRASDGQVLRRWTEKETKKAYVWDGKGTESGKEGEPYWSTYRHMLEQFVNRIKGRDGSGVWIDGDYSINQMKAIDSAYEKAGVAIRPMSSFKI